VVAGGFFSLLDLGDCLLKIESTSTFVKVHSDMSSQQVPHPVFTDAIDNPNWFQSQMSLKRTLVSCLALSCNSTP
jgi:hypothetical protein